MSNASKVRKITAEEYRDPRLLPIPAWYWVPVSSGLADADEWCRRRVTFNRHSVVAATHVHADQPTAPTERPDDKGYETLKDATQWPGPAQSEPVSAPQESAVPQWCVDLASRLICVDGPLTTSYRCPGIGHGAVEYVAAFIHRHAPQPGGGELKAAALYARDALETCQYSRCGDKTMQHYNPVMVAKALDHIRSALSTPSRPPSGPTDSEMLDWLLTGEQKVSPQAGWDGTQGQVRILQARFASEDGAFCGHKQITTRSAIRSAITAAMQAANKEDKS